MKKEQAIKELTQLLHEDFLSEYSEAIRTAIQALDQQPCEDAISRQAVLDKMRERDEELSCICPKDIRDLPTVTPQQKMGHCKDCKYFEYDSVAEVHGIPLIVAHEICKRWNKGCQTREDGYCFLFEPQEGSDKE